MNKTILITGCSTGIGKVTAKYFQQKGWNVAATVRKKSEEDEELLALDNVLVEELDVTKSDTIKSAVEATINRFGSIDALLNNAGYGAYGVLEATPESVIRQQFDVNVIGLLNVTKAVLPYMRKAVRLLVALSLIFLLLLVKQQCHLELFITGQNLLWRAYQKPCLTNWELLV